MGGKGNSKIAAVFWIITIIFAIIIIRSCMTMNKVTVKNPKTSKIVTAHFTDVGYFKNSIGGGRHVRVYSVYTTSADSVALLRYARKMMWEPGGMTYVLYFNDREHTPDVSFVGLQYSKKYDKYLTAEYYKMRDGSEQLVFSH